MHTKKYDEAYNYAKLGIESPSESMMAVHGEVQGNSNLFYQFFTGSRGSELTSENSKIVTIIDDNSQVSVSYTHLTLPTKA